MTKEELEKEAEEWVISNTEIYDDKFGIECEKEPQAKEAYLASAELREKRIAELEAQIEKMKCCSNCFYDCEDCNSKNKDCNKCPCGTCKKHNHWELRR